MSTRSNGMFKIVASVVIGLIVGSVSAGIYFGTQAAILSSHASSTVIHEDATTKEKRIDDRIGLHLAPIKTELQHIRRQLEKIDKKLGG